MEQEESIFTLDLCIEYYTLGKEMNWRSSLALLVFAWVYSIHPCPWPRKKIIFCSSNALLLVAMRTFFFPSPLRCAAAQGFLQRTFAGKDGCLGPWPWIQRSSEERCPGLDFWRSWGGFGPCRWVSLLAGVLAKRLPGLTPMNASVPGHATGYLENLDTQKKVAQVRLIIAIKGNRRR